MYTAPVRLFVLHEIEKMKNKLGEFRLSDFAGKLYVAVWGMKYVK